MIQDIEDNPWYGMYMTTAEVNLYLAEFKLLGANLPDRPKIISIKRFLNNLSYRRMREHKRL